MNSYMDLYKKMVSYRCVTRDDMIRLCGSKSSADWHIRDFLKKKFIERIRRDLYAVMSIEGEQPIPNRYQIASSVADDACIICHSAFEYYGYAHQMFYEVYFTSAKRVRPFTYDEIRYRCIVGRDCYSCKKTHLGVRVTSIEQTVIDSIEYMEKIAGLEETLRCLMLVPYLHEDKLLEVLAGYGRGGLYQKVGYILELFKRDLSLSESFFSECEAKSSASRVYLYSRKMGFTYNERWKLYVPVNLMAMVDEGAVYYNAV